jgi:hypothetical protein
VREGAGRHDEQHHSERARRDKPGSDHLRSVFAVATFE